MEERIAGIIYDAKCTHCGGPVLHPGDWKRHETCEDRYQFKQFIDEKLTCVDCGSQNLQPTGGCMVCMDCGWESCSG